MSRAISMLTVCFSLGICSAVCVASDPIDGQLYNIDIPSLNAAEALNRLAEQTSAIMLFPFDIAETRQANAVLGRYTLMDALGELLENSGLSSGLSDKRVIQIALDEPVDRKQEEGEMANVKVPIRRKIGTFFVGLFIATGVSAQEAVDTDAADGEIDEIIITGSRIPRDSFNVSTPLVTVGQQAIRDTGLGSLGEILIDEIPSLYEGQTHMNSQSQIGNTGVMSAHLRGLGTNRTLILLDGRRIVTNAYGSRTVSLNSVPTGMVDRVEVITGGSSAAYGSDAVAGVMNIITQQGKTGFGFESRYGLTTEGGGEELTVDVDYGTTFGDGRGYLFFAATYNDDKGIANKDRKRAQLEASYDWNASEMCNEMDTADGDQCMRDISPSDWRDRSDGTLGGVFSERSGSRGWWYDENNVLQTGFSEERDGLFSRQWDMIKTPNDQVAAALKVDYELSEKTKAYFQLQYSLNKSFNFKSMEDQGENQRVATIDRVTGEPGEITPGHIADDNPFIPDAIRNDPNFDSLWNGDWDRRYAEVGNITTDNERTTWRTWAGLQGSMLDDEWDWDLSVGYGNFEQYQIRSNEVHVTREGQALDSEFAADGVTIQCADAAARAAGCVPLNPFGIGSMSPEAADWIRVNPIINPTVELLNVLGYMTGELFEMPAGTVGAVFGFEWRRDSMNLRVSDGPRYGEITFNLVPPIKGDFDVAEVFAEMSFPLADNFTADVSVRFADYNMPNIDKVSSYNTGLIWEPVEGLIFRSNFARAQRAPDITELLSPRRGDYDSYNDICADATIDSVVWDTTASNGQGHDNCRLDPLVLANIEANGFFDDENNNYSPSAGNEDLIEETANTFTVGFSIAPSWLEGFRLAVDYWDITIDDAITSISNEGIMEQCYASSIPFGQPNIFCDDLTRDEEGVLVEILQRDLNLFELSTSGVDVALDYVFETDSFGELNFVVNYTHISTDQQKFVGVDGLETVDFTNQLEHNSFADVATGSLVWRYNDWRVRWRTAWKGPVVDDNRRVVSYRQDVIDNDALCASGDPDCVTNPEKPKYLWYGSYVRHDLSASYDMVLDNGSTLNIYGGVRNMFDKDPFVPRTGDNIEHGIGNYDSRFGGGLGRFAYLGVEMRFDD